MKRVVLLRAAMAAGSRVALAEVKIGADGHDVIRHRRQRRRLRGPPSSDCSRLQELFGTIVPGEAHVPSCKVH